MIKTVDAGERFKLRIGIDESTDDVITDINGELNVAGVGANMGARILNLADGGQILLSQSVHRQLCQREAFLGKFRELAPVRVKHEVLLQIYQYIDEGFPGLDCTLPQKWHELASDQANKALSYEPNEPPIDSDSLTQDEVLVPVPVDPEMPGAEAAVSSPGEQQIIETVAALTEAVADSAFATGIRFSGGLNDFQLLRLKLLAISWLQSLPDYALDNHELHRLYLDRAKLKASRPELLMLLRAMVNDSSGLVPGWYWQLVVEDMPLEHSILYLALTDSLPSVRQAAFALLSLAAVPIPVSAEKSLASSVTSDSVLEVRRAAVRYLGMVGGDNILPTVGSALVDPSELVSREARQSKLMILARIDPNRALTELLPETSLVRVSEILHELMPRVSEITSGALIEALENSDEEIRLFAIRQLRQRGELSIDVANRFKEDKSDSIRLEAYSLLVERGVDLDADEICFKVPDDPLRRWMRRPMRAQRTTSLERNEVVLQYYRHFNVEQLVPRIDWAKWAGADAYLALSIDHFQQFGDKLREDLRTEFAAPAESYYKQELEESRRIQMERSKSGSLDLAALGPWKSFVDITPEESARNSVAVRKKEYVQAALAGLIQHGSAVDIEYGRNLLDDNDVDVRIEAVRLVRKYGTVDDVADLMRIATSSDALLQELAATAALRLSQDPLNVAMKFLDSKDEILLSITVADLILRGNKASAGAFLSPYLKSPNDAVRARAMTFFVMRYEHNEIETLLSEYTQSETYYYDVVCCFDRALYSPSRLAAAYLRQLKSSFYGLLEEEVR